MNLQPGRDALDSCVREYGGRFLSTAQRLIGDEALAEDAVQDAMVSATRNLHRFRGDSQLSTWIGRIVINAALSRLRAIRRRREQSLSDGSDGGWPAESGEALAAAAPSPERVAWHGEIRALIQDAVDELPCDYRAIVVLRYFQDATIEQIAEELGLTANGVKLRLHRSRRLLQNWLVQRGYCAGVDVVRSVGSESGQSRDRSRTRFKRRSGSDAGSDPGSDPGWP